MVNADAAKALDVFDRITGAGVEPIFPDVFNGSYEQWIDEGGLSRWTAEYMRQPESATDPEQLRPTPEEQELRRRLQERSADG